LVGWEALAGQAVPAGQVAPNPRGLAAHGLTTLRIEAVPPTPTSGPPTSLVALPGDNRDSGVPAPERATERPVVTRGKVELVQATGLQPVGRDSAGALAEAPMQEAAAGVIR